MSETTTIVVSDIVDDLDEELDEIAAESVAAEDGSDEQQYLDQRGTTLDQRMRAAEEAAAKWGPDAEFQVAALSPGERARFGDLLATAQSQQSVETEGTNLRDIYWTAAGVVDAPFLDGDEDIRQRVVAFRDRESWFWHLQQYLRDRVTEENSVSEGNRKSYAQRLEERRPAPEQR